MKKMLLLLAFAFAAMTAFSQTKRIAHRSHSGIDNTFRLFASSDNFGNPIPDEVKKKVKSPAPKKDTLRVIMPGKKDTLKKNPPPPVTKVVVKEEVFAVLATAKYIVTL